MDHGSLVLLADDSEDILEAHGDILRDAVKEEGRPRKGLGTEIAELFKGIELDEPIQEFRGFDIKPPKFD